VQESCTRGYVSLTRSRMAVRALAGESQWLNRLHQVNRERRAEKTTNQTAEAEVKYTVPNKSILYVVIFVNPLSTQKRQIYSFE
jgi:hypothetical protein